MPGSPGFRADEFSTSITYDLGPGNQANARNVMFSIILWNLHESRYFLYIASDLNYINIIAIMKAYIM